MTSYGCVIQECEEKIDDLLKQKEAVQESLKKNLEQSKQHLQMLRELDAGAQEMVATVQQLKEKLEVCW